MVCEYPVEIKNTDNGCLQVEHQPDGVWLGDLREIQPHRWEAKRAFLRENMPDPTHHETKEAALTALFEDWRWYKAEKDFPRPFDEVA